MDKEQFVSLYNGLLKGRDIALGLALIQTFIEEEGNEEHRKHSDLFLNLILQLPPLYSKCLSHVLNHYVDKFSVVKVIKNDLNSLNVLNGENIVFVY